MQSEYCTRFLNNKHTNGPVESYFNRRLLGRRCAMESRLIFTLAREFICHEESLPPFGFTKTFVAGGDDMRFTFTRLEGKLIAVDFTNDPIFVDFVRVEFAVRGGGDVFCSRSRGQAVFFSSVDNPIIRLKRTNHVDVPELTISCKFTSLGETTRG